MNINHTRYKTTCILQKQVNLALKNNLYIFLKTLSVYESKINYT